MKVHDLTPPPGAHRRRKRVARGIGGKGGKTAGRGMKGQRARNTVRIGFEGGQMPFNQRIPKLKGFKNPFRVEYQAVNLDTIEDSVLTEVTPETGGQAGIGQGSGSRSGHPRRERQRTRLLGLCRGRHRGCRRERPEAAPAVRCPASGQRQRADEPLNQSVVPGSARDTPDTREQM